MPSQLTSEGCAADAPADAEPAPSPAEGRRRRQREEARRAILEATEQLLVENDGEFSMRTLVNRCGYTAPTIYHYFGDKDGLVDALLEERFNELLERARAVEAGSDPVENVKTMAAACMDFSRENPAFFRLVYSTMARRDRPAPAAEAARTALGAPLAKLGASGLLRGDEEFVAGQALWALLHGLTVLQLWRPDIEWAEDLPEVAFDALLRGLLARSEDARDS